LWWFCALWLKGCFLGEDLETCACIDSRHLKEQVRLVSPDSPRPDDG
jgi:hypothetical protein